MKKFKVGKYYIFNKNRKKIGKVKIYALVEIDGILHAVFTYYLDAIKPIRTLPVEIEGETQIIHFGEAAGYYLSAAAPVLLKPAKFKVGKEYFFCDKTGSKVHVFINARYRDPIDHKIKVIANYTTFGKVHTDEKGDEIAKLYDGKIVNAKNEVKE